MSVSLRPQWMPFTHDYGAVSLRFGQRPSFSPLLQQSNVSQLPTMPRPYFGSRSGDAATQETIVQTAIDMGWITPGKAKEIDYVRYSRTNTVAPLATYHTLMKPEAQAYHRRNGEVLEKLAKGTLEYAHTPWLKAERRLGEIPMVVVDTETTGLQPQDRIIQIAISQLDKSLASRHLSDFVSLIHPGLQDDGSMFPIHPGAMQTHGLTPEVLANEPKMAEVLPEIVKRIGRNNVVVAYNAKFDIGVSGEDEKAKVKTFGNGMLNREIDRWNKSKLRKTQGLIQPYDNAAVIDPFVLIQRIHPFASLSKKLTNHYAILMGRELENAHDAKADTDATADVLKYCLKYLQKHQIPLAWAQFVEKNSPEVAQMEPPAKAAFIANFVRNHRAALAEKLPVAKEPLRILDILRFQHGSPTYHEGHPGLPLLDISLNVFGWDGEKKWDGSDQLDREVAHAVREERDAENRAYLTHKLVSEMPGPVADEFVTSLRKIVRPNRLMPEKADQYQEEVKLRKEMSAALSAHLVETFMTTPVDVQQTAPEVVELRALLTRVINNFANNKIKWALNQGSLLDGASKKDKALHDTQTERLFDTFIPKLVDGAIAQFFEAKKELAGQYFYVYKALDAKPLIDMQVLEQLAKENKSRVYRKPVQYTPSGSAPRRTVTDVDGSVLEYGVPIRKEWLDKILSGQKTWEIRGKNWNYRGRIGLIESGSGHVMGTANLVAVKGPLNYKDLNASGDKHGMTETFSSTAMPYANTYAYVLEDVKRFDEPKPYDHPPGAVTLVRFPDTEQAAGK